jgi:hypothetical protein
MSPAEPTAAGLPCVVTATSATTISPITTSMGISKAPPPAIVTTIAGACVAA